MDMSNLLMGAQIKDLEESARKKGVEADKLAGVDTREGESRIGLNKVNTEIKGIESSFTEQQLKANLDKTNAELRRISIAGDLDVKTFESSVKEALANAIYAENNIGLLDSKTKHTDALINQVQNAVAQAWESIAISGGQLGEAQQANILKEMQQALDLKLTEMNISKDLKVEVARSMTKILTTLISGVSNIVGAGVDRKNYNFRTDF